MEKLLDTGDCPSVQDLAGTERINPSNIARILRLTLLAPDIVEAILDGRQPVGLRLDDLLVPFPVEREGQRHGFGHLGVDKNIGVCQPSQALSGILCWPLT